MSAGRTAGRIAAELLGTVAIALVLLGIVESLRAGDVAAGAVEGARLLFLFMDIGLGVWLVALVVAAVATRGRRFGVAGTLVAALVGALANLATVTVVGIVQQGWAPAFIGYAIEAGLAFLVAAAVAVPIAHRATRPTLRRPHPGN